MRCIRCGHDSKHKDRSDRTCPGCHQKFAFEPQDRDLMTDVAFQAAIDRVSGEGRVRWGVEHLYYEVCRRQHRKAAGRPALVIGLVLLTLGLAALSHGSEPARAIGWLVALGGGLMLLYWIVKRPRQWALVSMEQFNAMWKRWQDTHGQPKGVIIRRPRPPAPREREPDIADYSFDRAVVCDRARTVDLLLANSFHFENNCAVLSFDGYPAGPFATVKAMLRRNPQLHVFVLHDATPTGCRLAHALATDPEWFKGHVPVVDVGLRPANARALKGLWLPARVPAVAPEGGISSSEAEWLSAHLLELAAIRPEQILKRLYRAINRPPSGGGDWTGSGNGHGSSVSVDSESFDSDAGDGEGDADGFG